MGPYWKPGKQVQVRPLNVAGVGATITMASALIRKEKCWEDRLEEEWNDSAFAVVLCEQFRLQDCPFTVYYVKKMWE